MMTPASTKRSTASAQAAATLTSTPMSVRTLGWMPSATLALMMARSGNMQTAPMTPGERHSVRMKDGRNAACRRRGSERSSMAIHDLKEQIARLPEQPGVYLYANRDGRDDLRRQGAGAARPRAQLSRRLRRQPARPTRCSTRSTALDVIVTDSVVEALALENNLIKQRLAASTTSCCATTRTIRTCGSRLTEAFPRVLVARQVDRDGDLYAGPFLPATLARRTMSLTPQAVRAALVQRGHHRARGRGRASSTTSSAAWRRASRRSARRSATRGRSPTSRYLLEGRNEELAGELERRGCARPRRPSGSRRRRTSRRDARRCRRSRERQQKMATAELGDRDVFGVDGRRARAPSIQVFQVRARPGRRAGRRCSADAHEVAGGAEAAVARGRAAAVLRGAGAAAARSTCRSPIDDADVMEEWLSARAERKVRIVVPQRGDKRRLVDLAHAQRRARRIGPASSTAGRPQYDGARAAAAGACSCRPLPRRIECIDISTLQGSETVASLVVCEDGRMAKGEYRKYRVTGSGTGTGIAATRTMRPTPTAGSPSHVPEPRSPSPEPRFLDDFAAMEQVVRRRYAAVVEAGGPFPDLHGHRRRQGAARRGVCGARARRAVEPGRDRPGQEGGAGLHPRSRRAARARAARPGAAAAAAHPRRGAPLRRDLSSDSRGPCATCASELDTIAGVGARRRNALLTPFGSVAGVRRATREELVPLVGPGAAPTRSSRTSPTRRRPRV